MQAQCIGCGAPLRVLEADGEARAVRTCACPWPPRSGSAPVHLPPAKDEPCELVKAWTT